MEKKDDLLFIIFLKNLNYYKLYLLFKFVQHQVSDLINLYLGFENLSKKN